jgi:HEAT repeat protein
VLANIVRNDTDESIRRSAIRALGSRQDQESMKVLEELLKQAPPRRG